MPVGAAADAGFSGTICNSGSSCTGGLMDEHRTALKRTGRGPFVVVAVAALTLGVMIGIRVRDERATSRRSPPQVAETSGATTPAQVLAPADAAGANVDTRTLAALLDALSSDELFRRSVAEPDWVRRWTVVTDNVAEGASPRRQLAFAAPGRAFTVERVGRDTVIAQESYTTGLPKRSRP
jgi:hypothetical protein